MTYFWVLISCHQLWNCGNFMS